ncbi:MAG: hypothetical protein RIF41_29395 [Polyangiaceae bacterium]
MTSSDDWPYGALPPELAVRQPTWTCPHGICNCSDEETEKREHTIFFHDALAKRMAKARVRIHLNGQLVTAPNHAEDDGSLRFEVPSEANGVVLEWAPAGPPLEPHLPFRRRYRLDLPPGLGEATDQRLLHLGYERPDKPASPGRSLSRRVSLFQADYGFEADGRVEHAADTIAAFHDRAMLPELPAGRRADPVAPPPSTPVAPRPPDVRPPSQGAVAALQPELPRGALTVSDESSHNAHLLILLLQTPFELPRWFRDALELASAFRIEAHIDLASDAARARENRTLLQEGRITRDQIDVLDAAVRAIQSDKWHASTGTLRLLGLDGHTLPVENIISGIPATDPAVLAGGPVVDPPLGGEAVTMPPLSVSSPSGPQDYHVDDANADAAPGHREPGRGFIWVSDEIETPHARTGRRTRVARTVREVAQFTVHELACHADLVNQGVFSRHGRGTEADRRDAQLDALFPVGDDTTATNEKLRRAAALPPLVDEVSDAVTT